MTNILGEKMTVQRDLASQHLDFMYRASILWVANS